MERSKWRRFAPGAALVPFAALIGGCEREEQVVLEPETVREAPVAATAVEPLEPGPYSRGEAEEEVFLGTGTVTAIGPNNEWVSIAHDAVAGAGLEAGTREFLAVNDEPLALVEPGQRIEFSFLRDVKGQYVLTAISPTPPEE